MRNPVPELGRGVVLRRILFGTIYQAPQWKTWAKAVVVLLSLSASVISVVRGEAIKTLWRNHRFSTVLAQAEEVRRNGQEERSLAILLSVGQAAGKHKFTPVLRALAKLSAAQYPRDTLELYRTISEIQALEVSEMADVAILQMRLGQSSAGLARLDALQQKFPADIRLRELQVEARDPATLIRGRLRYEKQPFDLTESTLAELSNIVASAKQPDLVTQRMRAWIDQHPIVSAGDIHEVATWLMSRGYPRLAAEMIPTEMAMKSDRMIALKIDALLAGQEWESAKKLVVHHESPLKRSAQALLFAMISAREPGWDRSRLQVNLEDALRTSVREKALGGIAAVAGMAIEQRMDDLALRAIRLQLEHGFMTVDTMVQYLDASRRGGCDAASALRWLMQSTDCRALGSEATLAVSYLKLLSGIEVETTVLEVEKLREEMPASPRLKLLDALLAYRMGDLTDAGKKAASLANAPWNSGEQAILGALIAASDPRQSSASQPDLSSAFPEERALFKRHHRAADSLAFHRPNR